MFSRTAVALSLGVALAGSVCTPVHAGPQSKSSFKISSPSWNLGKPHCDGDHRYECDLGNDLIKMFDSLRSGDTVHMIVYSAGRDEIIDAALRASARPGVTMWLLTSHPKPDGEDSADVTRGVQRLVDGMKKNHQHVKVGWGSLSRSGKSHLEHRKIITIQRKNGTWEFWSDSGNWQYSLDAAVNDRVKITDHCIVSAFNKHFEKELWRDHNVKKTGPFSTCDGKRKFWSLPEAKVDPTWQWSKNASCGRGSTVTWASFYLTKGSKKNQLGSGEKMVTRLIGWKKSGAKVAVAANPWKWSVGQRDRLVKAGITVYQGAVQTKNGDHVVYTHLKEFSATNCHGKSFSSQGSTTTNATAYGNGNGVLTSTVHADAAAIQGGFWKVYLGRPTYKVSNG